MQEMEAKTQARDEQKHSGSGTKARIRMQKEINFKMLCESGEGLWHQSEH